MGAGVFLVVIFLCATVRGRCFEGFRGCSKDRPDAEKKNYSSFWQRIENNFLPFSLGQNDFCSNSGHLQGYSRGKVSDFFKKKLVFSISRRLLFAELLGTKGCPTRNFLHLPCIGGIFFSKWCVLCGIFEEPWVRVFF